MARSEVKLENEAAQSTNALGPLIGVAREDFVSAVALLLRETASDPSRFIRHSTAMAQDMVKIMTGKSDLAPDPKDKRFMDPAWAFNPFFRAGAQYYLAVQKGMKNWLEELELDELERNRANFIANIILDGLAPTNSLIGNPTAQKQIINSGGLSLIKGLQNAYNDIVHNKGMVSQVDKRPFKIGKNIATSKGSVVYRDEIMEVLQYAPTTEEVHEIPQLTIPPQINKMYINDLSPDKSVIKWQVDNGIQCFVISWKNPTKDEGVWGMDEYIASCLKAVDIVSEITGAPKVNVSSACSGGQTGAILSSKMAATKNDRLGALTFMVTVLHPKQNDIEAGSLMTTNGLELAKKRASKAGIVKGNDLARGFAWLRPNDLIWNYWVNNYLLGQEPPAHGLDRQRQKDRRQRPRLVRRVIDLRHHRPEGDIRQPRRRLDLRGGHDPAPDIGAMAVDMIVEPGMQGLVVEDDVGHLPVQMPHVAAPERPVPAPEEIAMVALRRQEQPGALVAPRGQHQHRLAGVARQQIQPEPPAECEDDRRQPRHRCYNPCLRCRLV